MLGLDTLTKAVADLQTTASAVKTFIADLKQQVADLQAALVAANNEDPAVQALADQLEQSVTDLNSVVTPPPTV